MRHRLTHHLGALGGEQGLVDLRLMRGRAVEWLVLMSEHQPLADGQRPNALVPRCRREPGTNSVRMLDSIDMLDQPHPGCLENVRRIALDEFEVPCD
jgi:hypothetical protein